MRTYLRNRAAGGCFFLTLVLEDRSSHLLVKHINAFRQAYRDARMRYRFETHAVAVLPDHVHMLITLPENQSDCAPIVANLKAGFSRRLPNDEFVSNSRLAKRERGIWQRRYWEHTIRNQQDFANHMDYIHYNPVKHGCVDAVKDWPYSTFQRCIQQRVYPQDWGGNPDADIYTD
ncbi:hypothetical protein BWD09_07915 [Neisseria dentiae]|uniref:Transposase IS200-like domain-containing protein n=1 Tax=Neisseria dentiae TaxID=194197 RepID=A0A1X3D884_9NEIS|nr:transposase [Neisseria dentiae]OSI15911.1 hypothetical protein BWD09_07915 [Neisseria dentiae]QMT45306.1 transposase [Neisseria dentiae]STZ51076.1 putative type I restriction-modification system DNA methylase [Neisseria dentiae]